MICLESPRKRESRSSSQWFSLHYTKNMPRGKMREQCAGGNIVSGSVHLSDPIHYGPPFLREKEYVLS